MNLHKTKHWFPCLTLAASLTIFPGCNSEKAVQSDLADYDTKMTILDQVEPKQTPLGIITNILAAEWPTLFTARNEEELFHRYALLTWNPTERNKKMLRDNLYKHPEYSNYAQLFRDGKLPAKKVKVKGLNTTLKDDSIQLYEIHATYTLTLQDDTQKDLYVDLQVINQGLDMMNSRFNTDGDVSEGNLSEPETKREQDHQEFIMRIMKENSWRMTKEQLSEMLKWSSSLGYWNVYSPGSRSYIGQSNESGNAMTVQTNNPKYYANEC